MHKGVGGGLLYGFAMHVCVHSLVADILPCLFR